MRHTAGLKAALPARYKHAGRRAFLQVSRLTTHGSRVTCPCCEHRWRHFARFHGEQDQCPGCGSLMRHRALLLYLRDAMHLGSEPLDVLHVGPSRAIAQWCRGLGLRSYVTADLDSPLVDVQVDVTALPFDDESFDFVLIPHVLEHVPDDRAAIRELFRVLRPGGKALVQVPPSELALTFEDPSITTPEERERVFGQYDHVRICGADYPLRLEDAGFGVVQLDYVARLDEETQRAYGLRPGEPFFLCTKPRPRNAAA